MSLPHCDTLFIKFLDPWYSADDRKRKQFEATRPDVLTSHDYVGVPVSELCVLNAEGAGEARARIDRMLTACRGDWPRYLDVKGDIDERWIAAFDEYYGRTRITEVIERSDPKDFSNDYLILVCEFGAALGCVFRRKQPALTWLHDWPYWESSLIDPRSGTIIPPFHWAVKKFSEYGVDDGFAEKIEMCLHLLEEKAKSNT